MRIVLILTLFSLIFSQQKIIELPIKKSQSITIKFMFRIGSINDPSAKAGLTHLTANLLNNGSSNKYSLKEKANLLFPMGARFRVSVDKEAVVFTGEVHKDHIDKFYDIFMNSILNNKFDESDFKRIKSNQLNYVSSSVVNTNDERLSKRVLEEELFKGHPYSTLVQGTQSGVESITRKDVEKHYLDFFTKNNLVIGIAGSYSKELLKKIKTDFGKLPVGEVGLVELPKTTMPKGVEVTIVSKPNTFGSAIFMGFPYELTRSSKDFAAMMVANSWFGEHRKSYSHLYQKMREERSLNYGDYSYLEWYPNGHSTKLPFTGTPRRNSYFSIWIRPVQIAKQLSNIKGRIGKYGQFITETDISKLNGIDLKTPEVGQAHFVIRQSLYELNKLIKNGLSEKEFRLTRDFIRGYIKQYIRTQSLRLGYLMDSYCYGRENFIKEMDEAMASLTREDVFNAIQRNLQSENMFVAVVTDDSEAEVLANHIRDRKKSPIIYKADVFRGLSKKLLEEDNDILRYNYKKGRVKIIKSELLFK